MNRRTLLTMLATLPLVRSAAAAGPVPPGATTPQVEELRNGWRSLLAKDADVAKDAALALQEDRLRRGEREVDREVARPDAGPVALAFSNERPVVEAHVGRRRRRGSESEAGARGALFRAGVGMIPLVFAGAAAGLVRVLVA